MNGGRLKVFLNSVDEKQRMCVRSCCECGESFECFSQMSHWIKLSWTLNKLIMRWWWKWNERYLYVEHWENLWFEESFSGFPHFFFHFDNMYNVSNNSNPVNPSLYLLDLKMKSPQPYSCICFIPKNQFDLVNINFDCIHPNARLLWFCQAIRVLLNRFFHIPVELVVQIETRQIGRNFPTFRRWKLMIFLRIIIGMENFQNDDCEFVPHLGIALTFLSFLVAQDVLILCFLLSKNKYSAGVFLVWLDYYSYSIFRDFHRLDSSWRSSNVSWKSTHERVGVNCSNDNQEVIKENSHGKSSWFTLDQRL